MTDNTVTKMKNQTPAISPHRTLLEQAIASGANVEVIERLMGLQERWEAREAKKKFNAAIAAFKRNPPSILKDVEVTYSGRSGGNTSYKYEDLARLLAAVDPALAEHGLWARFQTHSDANLVTVTCIIGHADGYSEADNTLSAAPDTSGSKNAVQAIGSAVTYLQRYTLKSALGLAAARDDDGRGAGNGKSGEDRVSEEQIGKINAILKAAKPTVEKKLLELACAQTVADIQAVKFDAVMIFLKKYAKAEK